ncbi:MAG TPA: hypothetical protein VKR82_05960 [Candidatus Acidoferrales bacterium]|nr:hypothetical protein [Candidatus Acidoferrales bacterium]
MKPVRLLKYGVLAGCIACVVSTCVMGAWPTVLNRTLAPLYVAEIGAWCIFAAICYFAFRFVRSGLRRSKRW